MKRKLAIFIIILAILPNIIQAGESEAIEKIRQLCDQLVEDYKQKVEIIKKVNVAVMDFETAGETSKKKDLGVGVAEIVSTLFTKYENFRVIERKKLSKIMKELELSLMGLVDDTSTKQVGRILSADLLLMGSISEIGANYSISARLVDVETAEVKAAAKTLVSAPELVPVTKVATLEMKYPVTALFRSALIPGWGSFYNDTPIRGWLYLGIETISVGLGLYFYFNSESIYRDYNSINEENFDYYVPGSLNPQEAATTLYDDAQSNRDISSYIFYGILGVWVINISDALITAIINNGKIQAYEKSIAAVNDYFKPQFYAKLGTDNSEVRIGYKISF